MHSSAAAAGPPSNRRRRWLGAALLLIIAAAGGLRLVGLDHLLIWHDEAFSLVRLFGYLQEDTQRHIFTGQLLSPGDVLALQRPTPLHGWKETLAALCEHPEHAPLYYLLGRLSTELPLSPIVALRGLSAIFGILLIPAVFWLARELFGRGPVPRVAAVLTACSPLLLLYAQEARQYALWLLLFTASSAALVRAAQSGRDRPWLGYTLLMTLGAYTHLLFLLSIPIHAIYLLARQRTPGGSDASPQKLARQWLASIGATLLAFAPWIWVILTQQGRMRHYTAWMEQPAGVEKILTAWGEHLTEVFVDLSVRPEPVWLVLLLFLPWLLLSFMRQAPRPAVWLILATIALYTATVLGPDLAVGGSRSLQTRYALPVLLSVQLIAAWGIGSALTHPTKSTPHRLGAAALIALAGLGLLSQIAILRAETWTTKGFSARNMEVARLANAGKHTLVLASESSVATGELISLAYHLRGHVRIWAEPRDRIVTPPLNADTIIALTPSAALRAQIEQRGKLVPLADSWQWLELVPEPTASPHLPNR